MQALLLAKLAIENADEDFHEILKERTDLFCQVVVNELCNKKLTGIKWDDLILRVEWKNQIINYVDSLSVRGSSMIIDATVKHPCKFDQTIIQSAITKQSGWLTMKDIEKEIELHKDEFNKRYGKVRAERLKQLHDFQN